MKSIEHISALSGDRKMLPVSEILPITRQFFRNIIKSLNGGIADIPKTPFHVQVVHEKSHPKVFIFSLWDKNMIVTTNICCLGEDGLLKATELVYKMSSKNPYIKAVVEPVTSNFMYSFIISPYASPQALVLAGEIESYIYFSLYEAFGR